jgi:hypothetical protein
MLSFLRNRLRLRMTGKRWSAERVCFDTTGVIIVEESGQDEKSGEALVRLLQDSPLHDVPIEHEPTYPPVRAVVLED